MDLLRNLGSAAATSLLQKSGISLPYSLGEKVHDYDGKSIWTLYDATKKDDSSPVSVFHFDASGNRRTHLPFARNALKKLRTTRHPDILKFIDVVEQGESMWIMTERVRPLRPVLFSWVSSTGSAKGKDKEREGWTIWGLHRIAIALAFLNSTGASTHGNVSIDSIFLSPSGEWRLGGLELLSSTKDENPVLFTLGSQFPRNQDISSPEVKKNGWNAIKELDPGISDAYALGLLLNSAFNQTNELPATAHPPHPAPTGASRGQIPPGIFPLYKRLLNPGTKQRLTCQAFLEIGMGEKAGVDGAPGRFFADNHLVRVCSQLEGYPLASDGEKAEFIRDLRDSAGSFPPEFAINRLIPAMFSGLSHGGANAEMVISLVLEFGKLADPNEVGTTTTSRSTYKLDQNQYNQIILTPLVKLFTSTDRATRMALLKNMPQFAPKLEAKVVQDGVWPHLQTGLSDTVAAIREATLIAINEIPNKGTEQ
ncbi:hypothetical protein PIIN_07644 [Serendipita indica DSM 11827]|uniref:Protein kinase domain-containing protein n=1 Tax=Serendipita indica (strain DSM 11827) TaxID=1109443 RepID=G4TQU8_SERID|nr:hypothetical protein PIIN_07644 [Serendipita indica DSM 11827]